MASKEQSKILVPIRYPLTDNSVRTLAAAGRLAHEASPAELFVLHVNLVQKGGNIQTKEFTEAIASALDDVDTYVITRRGFLVEKIIMEEAIQSNVDTVVIGASQRGRLRKFLSRATGNGPDIGLFLKENITDSIDIIEVDSAPRTPPTTAEV